MKGAQEIAKTREWQPASSPLNTRWAKQVSPQNVHPEYPRMQMVRSEWVNLNGLWDFSICPKDAPRPESFEDRILVPFPPESALSGVMKPVSEKKCLWYRRFFRLPEKWSGRQVLLHFGAVDWDASVFVNGKKMGTHRGGYDGFSFDITNALQRNLSGNKKDELVVHVFDPTDAGYQPRGKQVHAPRGARYTATSGIWQTVWLEPVNASHFLSFKCIPLDEEKFSISVSLQRPASGTLRVTARILEGRQKVAEVEYDSRPGETECILPSKIPDAKLWSPDSPHLYNLELVLTLNGEGTDEVKSYFAMRKISLGKDENGFTRMLLNGKPLFQLGLLDQGFWPDGLYTAPTDEALRYDVELTKRLGFNLIRKHVKVEPDRWYYWCDSLGVLVWQDMPSGDKSIGANSKEIRRSPESASGYERELTALIDGRGNHPCIVTWVIFNEGWGQWNTARLASWTKRYDPTRLVDSASGWADRGAGDVNDVHQYPGPASPPPERNRASVLGEFGGLGLPIKGHTWQKKRNWGYRNFASRKELTAAYLRLVEKLAELNQSNGLSGAVYTQTTDVESEVNGLITYDREVVKMDEESVIAANKKCV